MSLKLPVSLVAGAAALVGLVALNTSVQAGQNVQVTASVVAGCTLVADPLAFGTYAAGQSNDKLGQADMKYTCPSGLNITLTLNGGIHGNEAGRLMNSPTTGNNLPYQLFQEVGLTNVWGTGASGITVASTASTQQTHPVFGRIPSGEGAAPASNYADTVVFDLVVN